MKPREIEAIEEMCEEIWSLGEAGINTVERVTRGSKLDGAAAMLESLRERGLVRVEGGSVELSGEGKELARGIVRRHRLAEVLFTDVLKLAEEVTESTACEVEHILPPAVTDSICAYLGHPAHCPHGKAIPPGPCCGVYGERPGPTVMRLQDLPVGGTGSIVFIATGAQERLARLAALGIVPGRVLRLVQKTPSVVFEAGQTTVAVDPEIAGQIVVQITP